MSMCIVGTEVIERSASMIIQQFCARHGQLCELHVLALPLIGNRADSLIQVISRKPM
jgi:hypothetical protein